MPHDHGIDYLMSQPSLLGRFFRILGRSIDALRTFLGRLLFVFFLIIVVILLFGGPTPLQVPDGGLVVINPRPGGGTAR